MLFTNHHIAPAFLKRGYCRETNISRDTCIPKGTNSLAELV